MAQPLVAIGARLARFSEFTTLGLRPNLEDYPPEHLELIQNARRIFYPTDAFAQQFSAMGKDIYPSLECHLLEGDKIKQTTLFKLLSLDHPRTRIFYGKQKSAITDYFSFPFVAKKARGSALGQGVYLIRNQAELDAYLAMHNPAYIQDYLPIKRDIRVVVLGFEPLLAYWRWSQPEDFRTNVARGGQVDFEGVPDSAVELAVEAARSANLNEVGVDVAFWQGKPYLLEFNVKFGHHGPGLAGIDIPGVIAQRILAGEL